MNETAREKDFCKIISAMVNLGETRGKYINEIDDILDRIIRNRQPQSSPEGAKASRLNDSERDAFVNEMDVSINQLRTDNERLSLIIQRLNELI